MRVFVSSSLRELAAERLAARDAVRQLRMVPVMFEQGARPHPPRRLYEAYLAQSQVFVGIYAEEYGWTAPGAEISGIEDEYRLAGDMPRLIYVKRGLAERDPRLIAMLDRMDAGPGVTYREFDSPDSLRVAVERDLALLVSERFEPRRAPREPDRSAGAVPAARATLIGRDAEIAALTELLTDPGVPLVTLTGPGGVGKTRLALELADRLGGRFRDGVRYVELAAVDTAGLVGRRLADVLGVRISHEYRPVADVAAALRQRQMLLVVDNFEHVVDAAPDIAEILAQAPEVTALITSRAPIRIAAERTFAVPPLGLPGPGGVRLADALAYSSIRLFTERATAASRGFALTPENLGPVVEVCRRLDGLPLAIEIAAAKSRVVPPEALLDRLGLQIEGPRDLPARQRTLRATIAWSYDLLSPPARRLFTRLGLCDGFDLNAAEAAGQWVEPAGEPALDLLDELVESSLVRTERGDGEPRFSMLDSVRDYALDRLRAGGEWQMAQRTHADYYYALAMRAGPELNRVAAPAWLARLEADHDNLRAALDWYLDEGEPDAALRLGWAAWVYWYVHGYVEEARRVAERVLEQIDKLPPEWHGRAYLAYGGTTIVSGDFERAREPLAAARDLIKDHDDRSGVGRTAMYLGRLALHDGEFAEARRLLGESTAISADLGEDWMVALNGCGIGEILLRQGDHAAAIAEFGTALRIAREAELPLGRIAAHYSLAVGYAAARDLGAARACLLEGLAFAHRAGTEPSTGPFLAALADVEARRGQLVRAVRLGAAARSLRTATGFSWISAYAPAWPASGIDLDLIGPAADLDPARTEGAEMTARQAIRVALSVAR